MPLADLGSEGGMKAMMTAAALLLAGAANAQQMIYWPAPQTAAERAQVTYFPIGTPLTLVTRTDVTTKTAKPGDPLNFYVAEPLSYRGQVVIPAGATAVGEVGQAAPNGHVGKKGRLAIHVLSIETPTGPVRLSGTARDEGRSGLAASVATMAVVSWLGVFIHGTSGHLPAGSYLQAYLAEPLRFREQPGAQTAEREAQPDAAPKALAAR